MKSILLNMPDSLHEQIQAVLLPGETVTGFINVAAERAVLARAPLSSIDDICRKFGAIERRLQRIEAGMQDDGK
jgi:hypothetical protein